MLDSFGVLVIMGLKPWQCRLHVVLTRTPNGVINLFPTGPQAKLGEFIGRPSGKSAEPKFEKRHVREFWGWKNKASKQERERFAPRCATEYKKCPTHHGGSLVSNDLLRKLTL